MRIGNHGRHFFFAWGKGGEPPPFYRIINNFLLFYHGQLIRTYIKNTILEIKVQVNVDLSIYVRSRLD